MIIGIDASRANRDVKTGVEWYSYYIIQELKKIIPDSIRVFLYTDKKLKGELAELPAGWQEKILKWPFKFLWTQGRLSLEMIFSPPDVLFVPSSAIPFICPKNTLTTIHDIGFKKFPKCYGLFERIYLDWSTNFAVKKCAKIFVPSEFTKKDILENFSLPHLIPRLRQVGAGIPVVENDLGTSPSPREGEGGGGGNILENKIIVTPLGVVNESQSCHSERSEESRGSPRGDPRNSWVVAPLLPRDSSSSRQIGTPQNDGREVVLGDFILFIGRLTEKKNISRTIEAFKLFKKENSDSKLKLVLVGPRRQGRLGVGPTPTCPAGGGAFSPYFAKGETGQPPFFSPCFARGEIGGVGGGEIFHFDWLPPKEISQLLGMAKALIFPSLYEGFGLPILEAFAAGTPVITSKGIATEEIAGNAAILVNPLSVAEIKEAISKITSDENLRQNLIQKGLERVKDFSWQKTAELTMSAIFSKI